MVAGREAAEAALGALASGPATEVRAASNNCCSFGRKLSCASREAIGREGAFNTIAPTGGDTSEVTASLTSGLVSTCCADAGNVDSASRPTERTEIVW